MGSSSVAKGRWRCHMALISFLQLGQLSNPNTAVPNTEQAATQSTTATAPTATNTAANQDQFTPSIPAVAQDPGLFQAGQIALFSAAGSFLLAQNGGAAQTQTSAQPPIAAPDATQAAAGTAATNASVATQDNSQIQSQLQSLNTALEVLGLSPSEITVVDRVAQLVQDFNPTSYSDLINQLQAAAQAAAPQAPAAQTSTAQASANQSPATPKTLAASA